MSSTVLCHPQTVLDAITSQKFGFCSSRKIVDSSLSKDKSAILPLFNDSEVLYKAKLLPEIFS